MNQLPNIKLVGDFLEGTVSLPIWKGFQNRQSAYGAIDTDKKSTGEFLISIGGDMVIDNPYIMTEHVNAYEYLTTHSKEVYDILLTRLLAEYKNLQPEFKDDVKEIMPNIDNIEQFKDLIGLSQIHLLNVSKDNVAYVGYEFGCNWDEEHGLGFMTHKNRIIAFGRADTSFLTWVAEEDL